jgi:hypothetical protein
MCLFMSMIFILIQKKDYDTHHTQKIHIIPSKCDNVIENIQIHISRRAFFLFSFLGWNFAQMWKINIWQWNIWSLFLEKKVIRYFLIKNHVVTFPYWFWLGNEFLKSLDRFLEHVII